MSCSSGSLIRSAFVFTFFQFLSSEDEKGNDISESRLSDDPDLVDRIDAAHCHIYSLERSAKRELDKLQKHFDALKSNIYEHIESKTITLSKKLENATER